MVDLAAATEVARRHFLAACIVFAFAGLLAIGPMKDAPIFLEMVATLYLGCATSLVPFLLFARGRRDCVT